MNDREVHPIVLADGLILPPEAVTEGFAILANRGAGKSATATLFVEQLYKAGSPVVVVDVKGDWWGIRSGADGRTPGLPLVIFGGEHADVDLEPTAGSLVADLVVDDQVSAVLDLSDMSKTKARAFATDFAERLYRRNRDPLHVVVEEADVLIPQRGTAAEARLLLVAVGIHPHPSRIRLPRPSSGTDDRSRTPGPLPRHPSVRSRAHAPRDHRRLPTRPDPRRTR